MPKLALGTGFRRHALPYRTKGLTPMRTGKTGQTPTLVLEIASQGAMGVALGLVFAFMVILIPATRVHVLMAASSGDVLLVFVSTCALMFGVGAALTGLLLRMTQDS